MLGLLVQDRIDKSRHVCICGNANTHVFTFYHAYAGAEQSLDIIVCVWGGGGHWDDLPTLETHKLKYSFISPALGILHTKS